MMSWSPSTARLHESVALSVVTCRVEDMDDEKDFTAKDVLAGVSDVVRCRRPLEVEDLDWLGMWAALHSSDRLRAWSSVTGFGPGCSATCWVQLGGEGTPLVQDFCLGEIALARGTGVTATVNALADGSTSSYRLPLTWAVSARRRAEVHIARRVASCRGICRSPRWRVVDKAVARIIAHESGGRVLAARRGQDHRGRPRLHEAAGRGRAPQAATSPPARTDEFGLRTVIARGEAGDAVWVEATVARVAEIIAPRHPDATPDELRLDRVRLLAGPAELLAAAARAPRRAGARPRPRH